MAEADDDYFRLLEAFMDIVTARIVARGHDSPVFHVFSETSLPCPESSSGTFAEFPLWPVEVDLVSRDTISYCSAVYICKTHLHELCLLYHSSHPRSLFHPPLAIPRRYHRV